MTEAETAAIKDLLAAYEAALNRSDTSAVVKLYTDDGVFMPSNAPTAAGTDQLRAAYSDVFHTIRLDIKFEVGPIELFGEVAVVRTLSRGRVTVLANQADGPEENRELFALRKVGGAWKISRYMFNKAA